MNILAVETSGMGTSVALANGSQLLVEHVLESAGRRHARLLVPAVDQLLKHQSLASNDIDVVAVSIGPGSFTGLRVGVVFAKIFAWINQTQLVAVDTLQGLAQRAAPADSDITVISDAQRGDVFVNSYRCSTGEEAVQPVAAVRIESLASVIAALEKQSRHVLTGPGVERFSDRIPDSIETAACDMLAPRAAALLPAAREMILENKWSDTDALEPVYLRRSYAEEKRNT